MNDALEHEVVEGFLATAPVREPAGLYETIVTTTGLMRPRPRWLASLKEPPMRYRSHVAFGSPTARAAAVACVTLLVAILGAGALVAGAQSTSPAPEEDAAVSLPVEFTGHIVCGPEVRHGTTEIVRRVGTAPGRVLERGYAWQPYTTEMSEPRMEGDYYISYDSDTYPRNLSVGSGTWRIVNDEGAWQGSFVKADYADHGTTVSSALVGEGAYEGLTAIWESVLHIEGLCNWDVRGVIIEGAPPAVPEAYVGE